MRLPVRDADPLEPLHLGVEGLGGRPLRGKVHVARGEPAAACREGRTGEPFIDTSMRELAATGALSNRARQVVASWRSRTEGTAWRWGPSGSRAG